MTEDEAKTKWCPFARQAVMIGRDPPIVGSANRDSGEHYGAENCLCIASACMAWRSTRTMFRDASTGKLSDRDLTGRGSWVSTDGYCGLAGAPNDPLPPERDLAAPNGQAPEEQ